MANKPRAVDAQSTGMRRGHHLMVMSVAIFQHRVDVLNYSDKTVLQALEIAIVLNGTRWPGRISSPDSRHIGP